ncbi:MAG: ketopantoate reductase family protein [Candidatus Omnitrophica bacterium]|nr:ketopantoate reductase family protein [Candidatus Omnitrophota bacterium]
MKIAVIGAGAIGGLVAGYLALQQEDVFLVGHADSVKAIKARGLSISGVRGDHHVTLGIAETLGSTPDLAILATKTHDVPQAIKDNLQYLKGATLLTTQNGVRADSLVAQYLPREKIISSIVMFGATYLEPGKIIHNFEGSWIIGKSAYSNDEAFLRFFSLLGKAFPTQVVEDISGMKYLKIFVNANNCIPAILGLSMQEAFSDVEVSKISIAVWKEGLRVVNAAGIKLVSLPDFPLERVTKLVSLPIAEAARIYSGLMSNLSNVPLYGSILQSIKRGKLSEIDFINGEFVLLAKEKNISAPLNTKLVEMVHQVEQNKRFFSREELLNTTRGFIN